MIKSDDEDEYQMEADMEQMWAMRESGQADDDAAAVGLSLPSFHLPGAVVCLSWIPFARQGAAAGGGGGGGAGGAGGGGEMRGRMTAMLAEEERRAKDKGKKHKKEEAVERSVISGKPILKKLDKTDEDHARDAKRQQLLAFLNDVY